MLKYSANISTLWRDVPLRERLARVHGAGLKAFEFLFVSLFSLPKLLEARDEVRPRGRPFRSGDR